MSSSVDSCISTLNSLVILAAKYQLGISGAFNISRYKQKNEIDNEIFANVGLKYIHSDRLSFDGGIELKLSAIGELADILSMSDNNSFLFVSIYNLNNEDDELENYSIVDSEDCNFLNTRKDIIGNNVETLALNLYDFWCGNKIGPLRSYCAMKFGSST